MKNEMSFLGVSDIGVALIIPGVLELVGEHLEIYFFDQNKIYLCFFEIPPLPLPRPAPSPLPPPLQVCWITARSAPPPPLRLPSNPLHL